VCAAGRTLQYVPRAGGRAIYQVALMFSDVTCGLASIDLRDVNILRHRPARDARRSWREHTGQNNAILQLSIQLAHCGPTYNCI